MPNRRIDVLKQKKAELEGVIQFAKNQRTQAFKSGDIPFVAKLDEYIYKEQQNLDWYNKQIAVVSGDRTKKIIAVSMLVLFSFGILASMNVVNLADTSEAIHGIGEITGGAISKAFRFTGFAVSEGEEDAEGTPPPSEPLVNVTNETVATELNETEVIEDSAAESTEDQAATIIDIVSKQDEVIAQQDEILAKARALIGGANETESINETEAEIVEQTELQYSAEILKPVKWKKTIVADKETDNLTIEIPAEATLLSVTEIVDGEAIELDESKITEVENEVEQEVDLPTDEEVVELIEDLSIEPETAEEEDNGFGGLITGNAVLSGAVDIVDNFFSAGMRLITGAAITEGEEIDANATKEIVISENVTEVEVEYLTEAPRVYEEEFENGKSVTISSEFHYEDILAYTEIPETVEGKIRLYHIVNDTRVRVTDNYLFRDTNDNGLVDRVEWVVPHLSDQTYEIILATAAEHLDENRTFVEDVFDLIEFRDQNWTDPIPDGHFVRVTFEENLTSGNDITIFAMSNDSARVEVYEQDGTTVIADFGTITSDRMYKILLTNLTNIQDTFDLKIMGGTVEFDHIRDPVNNPPGVIIDEYNSTRGHNLTTENLTVYTTTSDLDNETVKEIFNWRLDGESIAVLNMPFENTTAVDNARDYSDFGNNGTAFGGVVWNSTGGFDGRGAYEFDGVDDYVRIENDSSLVIKNNLSIVAWINHKNTNLSDPNYILEKGFQDTDDNYGLLLLGDVLYFEYNSQGYRGVQDVGNHLSTNTWYHIAAVSNFTHFKFYVDGQVTTNTAVVEPVVNTTAGPLLIGRQNYTNQDLYFNGTIDDLMIFNRTLTDETIQLLYQNRTNVIFRNETDLNETWSAEITPHDGHQEGVANTTEGILIVYADPFIDDISNIPLQTVTEGGVTQVTFNVLATDVEGVGDLNHSLLNATFFKSGEALRTNSSCTHVANINQTTANYTCTIGIWYFDGAGTWDVNATTIDVKNFVSEPYSEQFDLAQTTAIVVGPSPLTWPVLSPTQINQSSNNDPLVVNNTGNRDIPLDGIAITSYDLFGQTDSNYTIPAANFTVNVNDTCQGTLMINNSAVNVTGSALPAGNNSAGLGQEQLYYCLEEVPFGILEQAYSTIVNWIVSVA